MNRKGQLFDFEMDAPTIASFGMGVAGAFIALIMFHFGGVHIGIVFKILTVIACFIGGFVVTKLIAATA